MIFKDEKNYDAFRRNVESTAHTHGTSDVLDAAFVPLAADADAVALFRSQQDYMYTVFATCLQTSKAQSLVRQYEPTRDAQSIWRDLTAYMLTSTVGALHKEKLIGHLTTDHLDSNWKGTTVSYIQHWLNVLRQYEALSAPAAPFDDAMKRTLLQSALSYVAELDNVKASFHLEIAQGRAPPTFEGYVTLVEAVATTLDSRATKSAGKSYAADTLLINMHDHFEHFDPAAFYEAMVHSQDDDVCHDINTPVEDLQIYRAKQTHAKQSFQRYTQLSLDRETWAKIPKEFQDVWDKFPPNVKNIILTGTRQKGAESALNKTPVTGSRFTPNKKLGWKQPQAGNVHESSTPVIKPAMSMRALPSLTSLPIKKIIHMIS